MLVDRSTHLWLPLAAAEATLERVGGKGAALARLAAAGLPTPRGVHLTTTAYRSFVAANQLQPAILAAVSAADPGDPAGLARAAATIQTYFTAATLPADIGAALAAAYATLGGDDCPVAVRSSATVEDLPGLSFAGQQETLLYVRGVDALTAAVQRCWASLWTARAIGYRARMGVDHQAVAMGVVVQVMVPAEVAGVLFTANPTSGDRDELVINASFGLGEALVAGELTPDTYLLQRSDQALKTVALGTKEVMTVPAAGQGVVVQAVLAARRAEQALEADRLRALAALGLRAETLFGGTPLDVEWAVAEGEIWLLQARPITNLPPAPLRDARWESPLPGVAWIRRQVVEHMPEPLSPLFESLYLREGLEASMLKMDEALGVPRALVDYLSDQQLFATVNGYAYMRGTYNFGWRAVLLVPGVFVGVPRLLSDVGVGYWQRMLPEYQATIARWQGLDPATATDQQLRVGVRELALADALYWFACTVTVGAAKVSDNFLDQFLAIAGPRPRLSSGLFLRGFPSKTLEAQAALERIAGRIRESGALAALVAATPAAGLREALAGRPEGRAVLADLDDYLQRYGHQIYSLDFVEPTLADAPLPALVSLKALAQQPEPTTRTQPQLAHERETLAATTAAALDPLRRRVFLRLLRAAQRFAPYREESLFYLGAAWPTLRRLALELGRRLAAAGSLDAADDVFYLEEDELAAASIARVGGQPQTGFARLARRRRELREARKRLHPPPSVPPEFRWKLGPFDLSARESQRRNVDGSATMCGFAVSPGRATAPVSLIRSPSDFDQMQPGTILVCPTTTPAWTPLLAQARGLITDIGGVLAHGSIVAREYGIPAVMGLGTATQRLHSGQQVTVDGDTGIVTLSDAGR